MKTLCVLACLAPIAANADAPACGVAVTADAVAPGCLPALTHDRRSVLVPVTSPDGARGNPNLLVRVVPVAWGKGRDLPVISADEWQDLAEAQRPAHAKPRIAAVERALGGGFTPLRAVLTREARQPVGWKAKVADLDVSARTGFVTFARDGATVRLLPMPVDKTVHRDCRAANEPYVGAIYLDGDVAALRFDYKGNDSCPEGLPAWVVLSLRAGATSSENGLDPATAIAANDVGMKQYHEHDWAAAAASFRAAIAADSTHVKAHYNLACVSALANDRNAALAELRWLSTTPDPAAKEKLRKGAKDPDLASLLDDAEARNILGVPAPVAAAPAASEDASKLWTEEPVGPLKIGMAASAVTAKLGAPAKKGATELEGATGLYVASWAYPGVVIMLGAEKRGGAAKVTSIEVSAPSTLTARGVGVGATIAELGRAWPKRLWDADSNDERVIVGSIYGGLIFSLEKGRVTRIFVGAAAE